MLTLYDLLEQVPPAPSPSELESAELAIRGMVEYSHGEEAEHARAVAYEESVRLAAQ
jgi:hypothetical protein